METRRGATSSGRRPRARGLQRLFFRTPSRLYWGPLARLFAWRCILLLTTVGRKTGRNRRTCLSFLPMQDRLILFAGWGEQADWYQNVLAHPEVTVRVGSRRFAALAQPVADRDRRAALMHEMAARINRCGPPRPMRPLLRAVRLYDYEAEISRAVSLAGALPLVEIIPREP